MTANHITEQDTTTYLAKDTMVNDSHSGLLKSMFAEILSLTDEEFEEYKEMILAERNTETIISFLSILEECRNSRTEDEERFYS